MSKLKYKLTLNGTVSDGKYTQSFTEKDVIFIEIEFGDKKLDIGKKPLEQQIKYLKQQLQEINKATLHAGCMGNSKCQLCSIRKILEKEYV